LQRSPAPAAAYDFEGTGSQVVDRSDNDHSGVLVGASRVSGRGGTVLQFDRTDQEYARLGGTDTLDPQEGSYTVSLWFRTDSDAGAPSSGGRDLFGKRGSSNERFLVHMRNREETDGKLVFMLKDDPGLGADKIETERGFSDDEWHHVVAVRDAEEARLELYVDDELRGSMDDSQGDVDPNGPAYLAGRPERGEDQHYYTGRIDDVTIWTAAVRPSGSTTATTTPTARTSIGPETTIRPGNGATGYDLASGTTTAVMPDEETYYVVSEIPDVEEGRLAVTTESYDLVDTDTARDALAVYTWSNVAWPMDWGREHATLARWRDRSANWRTYGRALDQLWDCTEILLFVSMKAPQQSVGPLLEMATDAIAWDMQDAERPYREAFGKLTACTNNARTIRELAGDVASYRNLASDLQFGITSAMNAHDLVEAGRPLAEAARTYASAVRSTGSFTGAAHAALAGVDDAAARKLFTGFAISSAVGLAESAIEHKTTIHAVTNAFATMALPLVDRLRTLQGKLVGRTAPIGAIVEYNHLVQSYFQMNALHFQVAGKYWEQISTDLAGPVWNVLVDAADKADARHETAANMRETVHHVRAAYGAGWQDIREHTARSINAAEFGGARW
jgi:hypothetical protein